MIRKTFFKAEAHSDNGFRFRGHDIKRIETFSDGVFAFAVTLLIVSLEVPKSFAELLISMRGFVAFAICFTFLLLVWHEQHVFFRRYALDDRTSIFLNAMLVFIVLFYVYPLKFLFTVIFADQIYGPNKDPFSITPEQMPQLMIIYGLGYIVIYLVFMLLYLHALRKKAALELTALEVFDTRTKVFVQLILLLVGLFSVLLAMVLPLGSTGISGLAYMTIGPALWIFHSRRASLRNKIVG